MNITFLIGNGFDRNMGLDTTYSDFIKVYKKSEAKTQILKELRFRINENETLWSSAELAFGQYTSEFGAGEAEQFAECQEDFCQNLANYLKKQESRIDYSFAEDAIIQAFSRLNDLTSSFPTQERIVLDGIYKNYVSEEIKFNFICYNYTRTLDECISVMKKKKPIVGSHKYGSQSLNHTIGQLCHVHGTVEKEMVFGVNDETQILNLKLFDCDDGDLYKNLLIKKQANESYKENTDEKAKKILTSSKIIYVYGMSIGDTDNLWWDRICTWLANDDTHHLILQKHGVPSKGVFPMKYQQFERNQRRKFLKHSQLEGEKRTNIESRIHITGENIFESICKIADHKIADQLLKEIGRSIVKYG